MPPRRRRPKRNRAHPVDLEGWLIRIAEAVAAIWRSGSIDQLNPAGETGCAARRRGWRRRRNRPGNAQANGPQGDDALESSRASLATARLTDGVKPPRLSVVGGEISQVPRQRGLGRAVARKGLRRGTND